MTEIAATAQPMPRLVVSSDAGAVAAPVRPAAPTGATPTEAPAPPVLSARSAGAMQEQIDRVLADAQTSLRFRVDEESNRVVVAVLDGRGDVILQVPNEAALALAKRIARGGSLIDDRA